MWHNNTVGLLTVARNIVKHSLHLFMFTFAIAFVSPKYTYHSLPRCLLTGLIASMKLLTSFVTILQYDHSWNESALSIRGKWHLPIYMSFSILSIWIKWRIRFVQLKMSWSKKFNLKLRTTENCLYVLWCHFYW